MLGLLFTFLTSMIRSPYLHMVYIKPIFITILDIYVCSVSAAHNVSAQNKWLAFISTTAETANHEAELQPAFNLIGPIEEKFIYAQEVYHPKDSAQPTDNVSIICLIILSVPNRAILEKSII